MVMKKFVTKKFAAKQPKQPKRFGGLGEGESIEKRNRKRKKLGGKGKPGRASSVEGKTTKGNCSGETPAKPSIAEGDFRIAVGHCRICQLLSPKKQRIYAEAWTPSDGQSASHVPIMGSDEDPGRLRGILRKLERRYGITRADCEHHARVCVAKKEDSRYSRVAHQFDQLWTALDLAHEVYMNDPSMFNAQGYTALVRELRGCLMDLSKVQSADELADEIVATALNPMTKRFTSAIISECSRMKEDILARFSEEDADKLVNAFVERLAIQIQDAVPYARDRIADALSARDKNRRKAIQGKATMSRGKATGLPHSDSETKGKLLSLPNVG